MQQRQPHTHLTCGFCMRPKIIRSKPHETKSGQPICEVPHHMVAACCNDTKAAAKMALDKLIEKAGPERVRSVLAGA